VFATAASLKQLYQVLIKRVLRSPFFDFSQQEIESRNDFLIIVPKQGFMFRSVLPLPENLRTLRLCFENGPY